MARFLKKIDILARLFMIPAATKLSPHALPPAEPTSLLLIRPGGIGDAVHLVPAIQSMRKKFPGASIDILAERRNAAVFDLAPDIRKVMRYDLLTEFFTALRSSYDVVIDTEQWHCLSAVVARLIRSQIRIGFDTNERRRLFTFRVAYSHNDYEVASFLHLLEPLGISCEPGAAPWLKVPEYLDGTVGRLLAPFGENRFVVIFPGASIPERRWGGERFAEVAGRLAQEQIPVVVVGGEEDAAEGEVIVNGGNGLNLAGKTTLAETAAVIDRSALLISGDSGILHIGVALGKPTVSLFGPGIAAKWAPRGAGHIVLNRNLDCSPCTKFGTTPPCQDGVRCMAEITAQEVVAAAERLIFPAEAVTG